MHIGICQFANHRLALASNSWEILGQGTKLHKCDGVRKKKKGG